MECTALGSPRGAAAYPNWFIDRLVDQPLGAALQRSTT
jgi:hypothetical protein